LSRGRLDFHGGVPVRVTAVLWAGALTLLGVMVGRLWPRPELGFDLAVPWQAARVLAAGHSPYAVHNFVYPPSCALLIRPLGLVELDTLRHVGLLLTAAALLAAVSVAARAVGLRALGPVAAIGTMLLVLATPGRDALSLENLDCLIVLGLALILLLARGGRWSLAGATLGVTLAVKPILAPVLVVLVLERRWRALALAVAVPTLLDGIAWIFVPEPGRYLKEVLPYLSRGEGHAYDPYNSALPSVARLLDVSPGVGVAVRVVVALATVLAVVIVWRHQSEHTLRLVTTSGLALLGTLLVSPLSEDHHALMLVPLLLTVALPTSYLRSVPAVVGLLLVLHPLLPWRLVGDSSLAAVTIQRCAGLLLLIGAATVAVMRRHGVALRA